MPVLKLVSILAVVSFLLFDKTLQLKLQYFENVEDILDKHQPERSMKKRVREVERKHINAIPAPKYTFDSEETYAAVKKFRGSVEKSKGMQSRPSIAKKRRNLLDYYNRLRRNKAKSGKRKHLLKKDLDNYLHLIHNDNTNKTEILQLTHSKAEELT